MGAKENISVDEFPEQGSWLGREVTVCFHYDTSRTIDGTIVREDMEAPNVMIIRLDDNRYVLSTECQYSPKKTN